MPTAAGPWPRLRKRSGPSPLELRLKKMIESTPGLDVHPHSPSGATTHAVLFTASGDIMGNAHQATPDPNSGWTARAFIIGDERTLRAGHVCEFEQLPVLIKELVADAGKLR